jgi:hypothetical protein
MKLKEECIMATMNKKRGAVNMKTDTRKTVNHEGSVVHKLDTLEILFSKVLSSFFGEGTHYEKRTAEKDFKEIQRLIAEIPESDVEYALKVARIGREYNMIQYPLAVLTACFNDPRFKGENFIDEVTGRNKLQTYTDYIVRRGKDITDIMAMQMNVFGFDVTTKGRGKNKTNHRNQPLPMQLRKSLKMKLESFNEYQLSKALGDNREVSLADCIKLLRPNPANSRVSEDFYKRVIEGNVEFGGSEETKQVQAELSKVNNKNSKTTKADVKKSIDTSTVMAIVKNLVALDRAGMFSDSKAVDSIVAKLTNKKEVQKSRLLPFRFYSAYQEVSKLSNSAGKRRVMDALVEALDLSIDNLQDIEGYSAILIDRSGSMRHSVSGASNVTADIVACMLGAICFKKGIADVYVFADRCEQVTDISKKSTVMDIMKTIMNHNVGSCTNLDTAINVLASQNTKYDNLIILSDGDCYSSSGSSFRLYVRGYYSSYNTDEAVNILFKKKVIKKLYLDNLLGNSFAIVNTDDFRKNLITGFSERVVDVINVYSSIGSGASDVRKIIDSIVETLPTRK